MNPFTRALGKLCVIVLPPLLLMGSSFLSFKLLRDTYTAESRISVQTLPNSLHQPVAGSAQHEVSAEKWLCMQVMCERLMSDSCLQLSGLAFAISDLNQEPGRPHRSTQLPTSQHEQALDRLPALMAHLTSLNPPTEDSLLEVLEWLGYTPEALKRRLVVRPIPQTSQIRIQASAPSPEFSMYLANSFSRISCKYLIKEKRQQLHNLLDSLSISDSIARLDLRRAESQLPQARQEVYTTAEAAKARDLQSQIEKLSMRQVQLKSQLDHYRAIRPKYTRPRRTPVVKASDRPEPPSEWDVATRMAELAQLDAEILRLKKLLLHEDSVLLTGYHAVLDSHLTEIDSLQACMEIQRESLTQLPQHLTFNLADRSRLPSPLAAYGLSLLVGWAAFLVWLLFLFQAKYLRWPQPIRR